MRNVTFAVVLAVLALSCKKDCKKEGTMTVTISNQSGKDATVYLGKDLFQYQSVEMAQGESRDFQVDLVYFSNSENKEIEIGSFSISYNLEGEQGNKTKGVKGMVCGSDVVTLD